MGLVETTIDRIVPEQTDPNVIRTESYCHLPMDGDAFLGPVPAIAHTELVSPFHSCTERKLYMLNMAHATCAYLGTLRGVTLIPEAMAIEAIRRTVTGRAGGKAPRLSPKNIPPSPAPPSITRKSFPSALPTPPWRTPARAWARTFPASSPATTASSARRATCSSKAARRITSPRASPPGCCAICALAARPWKARLPPVPAKRPKRGASRLPNNATGAARACRLPLTQNKTRQSGWPFPLWAATPYRGNFLPHLPQ